MGKFNIKHILHCYIWASLIVAINYRLGVFGFINIGNDTMTGNYEIKQDLF